ncbi:g1642 [Coccomyxa viridis]|uniref:NAD-dependent protein deacylase n=1 Tax=Coccomyxa viridis TaxID=1274662 RepID=A0ABP1FIG0_9CHLO
MATQAFQALLQTCKHVVVLTGAGVSAESGVPTFRGSGGLWRTWNATDLATPGAFVRDPSLVWEFYNYRRELVQRCRPNPAHLALAAFERKVTEDGRRFTLITQNIDGLHAAAGSRNVVLLHGSLWDVCRADRHGMKASKPCENRKQPLVPALEGKGAPDPATMAADIPREALPRDDKGHLLRPGVVWFGENLDPDVLSRAQQAVDDADLFITVGTSSVVYPAAGFVSQVAARGVPCAEVNLESSGATASCKYTFQGRAGEILPDLLEVSNV